MVLVLRSPRFLFFLLVNVGFTFLYSQVYNVLPLYLATVLEKKPAVDLYTMANPLVIVASSSSSRGSSGGWRPCDRWSSAR